MKLEMVNEENKVNEEIKINLKKGVLGLQQ